MNIQELKIRIGRQAEEIIASSLGLQKSGNKYKGQCPHGGHSKDNPVYEWKDNHFFCHDCRKGYDIIDLVRSNGGEWYNELCVMAGIEIKEQTWKTISLVSRKRTETGASYLQGRGITPRTQNTYHVTTDDKYIYFNYATPQNKLVATKWRDFITTDKTQRFKATDGGTSIFYGMHLLDKQKELIICEGEIDALSMFEIITSMEMEKDCLCSSLPNGSGSLNRDLVDTCRGWLNQFEKLTIIPDQDEAGKKFTEDAQKFIGEYNLNIIKLPCLDVNDYIMNADYEDNQIFSNSKALLPELLISKKSSSLSHVDPSKSYLSGYVTVDFNFAGVQEEWLTVLTGPKGQGKTTFARQILLAFAKQNVKSFMFCGEDSAEKEKGKLARLATDKTGVMVRANVPAGAKRFDATKEAMIKFDDKYGDLIMLSDMKDVKTKEAYSEIYIEMKKLAKHGLKLFIIDNLMKLTLDCIGKTVFDRQRQVISDLKLFVDTQKVHVVLIAHPTSSGDKISGVEEIVNTCDGIIKFTRLALDGGKKSRIKIPNEIQSRVSSYATFLKARDDGTFNTAYFEWDAQRGALIDISKLPAAKEYEKNGFWTRSLNDEADEPEQNNLPYADN